jgi:hypothetical protein
MSPEQPAAPLPAPNLTIIPPDETQPRYRYNIQRAGGQSVSAALTYDLLKPNSSRSLLRINATLARGLFPENADELAILQALVQSKRQENLGNLSVIKGVVCDIFGQDQPLPGVTVTNHNFGAVPVLVIPGEYSLPHEPEQLVRVAVYPGMQRGKSGNLPVAPAKADLLRSYRHHLDVLLRSYLEEVAAEFHDIRTFASRLDVFRRLKNVETVLAESVKPKVADILDHAETKKDAELYKLARAVWERFGLQVTVAALARAYALFFVNQLYGFLGIQDVAEKYTSQYEHYEGRCQTLLGFEAFKDTIESTSTDLGVLDECWRLYHVGGNVDFSGPLQRASNRAWLREFVAFAEFVDGIRGQHFGPTVPHIFVSAQHRVGAALKFAEQVERYLERRAHNGVPPAVLTRVHNEPPGGSIERLVGQRIWSSTSVIGVIPKEWANGDDGNRANLGWVAREADHALILKKKVHLFVEANTPRDAIHREFERDVDYLVHGKGRIDPVARRDRLTEHVKGIVNGSFHFSNQNDLDGKARDGVDHAVEQAREAHGRTLFHGFMAQFERDDQETIARVLLVARYPMKKKELVPKLAIAAKYRRDFFPQFPTEAEKSQAESAFRRAYGRQRKRLLVMNDGELVPLIEQSKQKYKGRLREYLRYLRPEQKDKQIDAWHSDLLRPYVGTVADDPAYQAINGTSEAV